MPKALFMKKVILILSLSILLIEAPWASAQKHAGQKLQRGIINVVTAPLEVPKQARVYWKEGAKKTDHILVWIFSGAAKGMADMTHRIVSGVWDIITFPFNIPKGYEPLKKPDYVLEDWPK